MFHPKTLHEKVLLLRQRIERVVQKRAAEDAELTIVDLCCLRDKLMSDLLSCIVHDLEL